MLTNWSLQLTLKGTERDGRALGLGRARERPMPHERIENKPLQQPTCNLVFGTLGPWDLGTLDLGWCTLPACRILPLPSLPSSLLSTIQSTSQPSLSFHHLSCSRPCPCQQHYYSSPNIDKHHIPPSTSSSVVQVDYLTRPHQPSQQPSFPFPNSFLPLNLVQTLNPTNTPIPIPTRSVRSVQLRNNPPPLPKTMASTGHCPGTLMVHAQSMAYGLAALLAGVAWWKGRGVPMLHGAKAVWAVAKRYIA